MAQELRILLLPMDDEEVQPIKRLFDQDMSFYLPCDKITYRFVAVDEIRQADHVMLLFSGASKEQHLLAIEQMQKLQGFEGIKLLVDTRRKGQRAVASASAIQQAADLNQFIFTLLKGPGRRELSDILLLFVVSEEEVAGLPWRTIVVMLIFFVALVAGMWGYVRARLGGE